MKACVVACSLIHEFFSSLSSGHHLLRTPLNLKPVMLLFSLCSIAAKTEEDLRKLLNIPSNYKVMFLQGEEGRSQG